MVDFFQKGFVDCNRLSPNKRPTFSFIGTLCIWHPDLVTAVPADDLAPDDGRPSADTVMNDELDISSMKDLRFSRIVQFCGSGAHFTDDFPITIKLRWKIFFTVIPSQAKLSLQIFAHATTAELSCHMQNMLAISSVEFAWEQHECSVTLKL